MWACAERVSDAETAEADTLIATGRPRRVVSLVVFLTNSEKNTCEPINVTLKAAIHMGRVICTHNAFSGDVEV